MNPAKQVDAATTAFCERAIAFVKKSRARTLTDGEKLDILCAQAVMRHAGEKDVRGRLATLFKRSPKVIDQVWSSFVNDQVVPPTATSGNRMPRPTRIPRTRAIASKIQEFVRLRRQRRARTVAKDVLAMLEADQVVDVDHSTRATYNSALRAVQRLLRHLGYKRGKRKGKGLGLAPRLRVERDKYVLDMSARLDSASATGRQTAVYLDESYIHHHYSRHKDSLFDPNDEHDLFVKEQHKGGRWCFIGAIVDQGIDKSMFICPDIFKGGKGRCETKDYHGMFNGDYFVEWFKGLLCKLTELGLRNTVIVLDNAKYHKTKPSDTPVYKDKKAVLQAACDKYNIPYTTDTKPMLWDKLRGYIAGIASVIVQMAEDQGHTVLYTPPHHSDLQPIETIWAIVKGQVGRAYTSDTTLIKVRERLEQAFADLQPKSVYGSIIKAEAHLKTLLDYITTVEDSSSDDDGDEGDGVEDDSWGSDADSDTGSKDSADEMS